MTREPRSGFLIVLLMPALTAHLGCSEELGPERIPTTSLSGTVSASGRPLGSGWVELQPFDGTLGDPASARIGPDGRFRFDRAPVGQVVVRLVDIPVDLGPNLWTFRNSSPIHRDTRQGGGPTWDIDVADEILALQMRRGGSR